MSEKRYGTKSEKQKAYRERKKTAHDPTQNNLPVLVLAEPQRDVLRTAGARESTNSRTVLRTDNSSEFTTTPDSCGGQNYLPNPAYETASHEFQVYDARIVTYDKKKYPNRQAWEIAVQRVERAIRYAQMFPHLIGSDDLKFRTLDWQYENEGLKAPTS